MSGWVNAGSGEPMNGTGFSCEIALPVIPQEEPKTMVTFQGPETGAQRHWVPLETEDAPTPYEVRRDALSAAAAYCSGGGWGGAENVIEKVAKPFEEYLKGAL